MTSWTAIRDGWSARWRGLHDSALRKYTAAIEADPSAYADKVDGFVRAIETSRATLDRMQATLSTVGADGATLARYRALRERYLDLAAGLYAEARPAGAGPETGIAPIVLVVGAVALTVVGVAWAVVAYAYAENLEDQTALQEKELTARIEASKDGRTLPPSTLPAPARPEDAAAKGIGLLVVGGLVLIAGAVLVPALTRR